MSLFLTEK